VRGRQRNGKETAKGGTSAAGGNAGSGGVHANRKGKERRDTREEEEKEARGKEKGQTKPGVFRVKNLHSSTKNV